MTLSGLRARVARLPVLAAAIPPLLVAGAVWRCALNVPLVDQWPFAASVVSATNGRLGVGELWMPNNEHRVVVPRLVMLALAHFTRWDVRYEIAVNVLAALGTFAVLVLLIGRTVRPLAPAVAPWLVLAASLAVFSMAQWQNWTWGWQMAIYLNVLAAAAAAWALSRWGARWPGPGILLLAELVAVFSFGSGLLLFGLVPLALIATRAAGGERRWLPAAALLAIGAAIGAAYVRGLTPAGAAAPVPAAPGPVAYASYVLTYLGAGLAPTSSTGAMRWGAAGLAALVGSTIWLWLRAPAERPRLVPWLLLALYAVLSGVLTAAGRLRGGPSTALLSRYVTISALFWVSAPVLVALAAARWSASRGPVARVVAILCAAAGVAAVGRGWAQAWSPGWESMRARAERTREGGDCLRYLDFAPDGCLTLICWDAGILRFFAGPLRAASLGPFARFAAEPPLSAYTVADDQRAGRVDPRRDTARPPVDLVVTGWSRSPAVLVVVDGVVAARVMTGGLRADLEPALRHAGWRLWVKVKGHRLVEAYGIVDEHHVAKLDGAIVVSP